MLSWASETTNWGKATEFDRRMESRKSEMPKKSFPLPLQQSLQKGSCNVIFENRQNMKLIKASHVSN